MLHSSRFALPFLFASAFGPFLSAQSPVPAKPNVLLIMVDDLAEYVGFLNGHPQTATPNMDRLASRGTVFLNAYCNSPQCAPSRTSMMSGKLPDYTGIYEGGEYDDSDFRSNFMGQPVYTLPEILKDSGQYYTVGVRKLYHARNHNLPGNDADLDESTSDECARGKSWSSYLFNSNSDPEPSAANKQGWNNYEWGAYGDSQESLSADYRAVDKGIDFLTNYRSNPGNFCDRPFFLGVGLFRPHIPYFVPQRYFSEYYQPDPYLLPYRKPYNDPPNAWPPNGVVPAPSPDEIPSDWQNLPYIGKVNANQHMEAAYNYFQDYPNTLSPSPIVEPGISDSLRDVILSKSYEANALIAYLASIRFVDEQIGRLLTALESMPEILENTIIILVSDHGYAFGEKLHHGKVALWDQVTRIPMVIVDPSRPGKRISYTPVSLLDIYPTVLELTGTPAPRLSDGSPYLDGQSIVPLLDNPEARLNKPVLTATQLSGSYPDGYCFPMHAVSDQRFHYIRYVTNGGTDGSVCEPPERRFQEELYEIGERRDVDPNEFHNLAEDPQYQGIKDYLAQFLPGGDLYNQKGGIAQVIKDDLDCVLNLNVDVVVRGQFTDPDGTVHSSAPEGIVPVWSSPALFAPVTGDSVVLGLSTVDPGVVATLKRLPLTLTYYDTASGAFYRTIEQLNVLASNVPMAAFLTTESEPATFSFELLSTSGFATRRVWDFGDGTYSEDILPPAHRYAAPGSYLIKHTLYYGNDSENQCTRKDEQTVVVDASDFGSGECPVPEYLFTTSISSNNAKLKWNPVYGANRYQFRARPISPAGQPWLIGSRTEAFVILPGLDPNSQYEYQVRAICPFGPADTSDWSAPKQFSTPTCFAPVNVAVDNITSTTALVSWEAQNPGIIGHEVLAKPVTGSGTIRIQVAGASSTPLNSLLPGTNYQLAVRPRCPNALGNPGTPGPLSNIRYFSTLSAREAALPSLNLQLQPNPAAEIAVLQVSSPGGMLRITDGAGRLVLEQTVSSTRAEIDVAQWPAGFYLVEWQPEQGTTVRTKLMVQR